MAQLDGIPCHLVGMVDVRAPVNAAWYVTAARGIITAVRRRGHLPVLTAGTGLYLRALLEGFELGQHAPEPQLRAELDASARLYLAPLYERLRSLAPAAAERIDARNPRRVVRALELAILGRGDAVKGPATPRFEPGLPIPALRLGLTAPRQLLDRWIEERADRMFEAGILEEVRALVAGGIDLSSQALSVIGVPEVAAHLRGELSLQETRLAFVRKTREYSRRQLAWFRTEPDTNWFDVSRTPASDIVESIAEKWIQTT